MSNVINFETKLSEIKELHGENYLPVLAIIFGYLIFDYKGFNDALEYFSSEKSLKKEKP